jgi:hypothetical protein
MVKAIEAWMTKWCAKLPVQTNESLFELTRRFM